MQAAFGLGMGAWLDLGEQPPQLAVAGSAAAVTDRTVEFVLLQPALLKGAIEQ
jgi:hypothetical protein